MNMPLVLLNRRRRGGSFSPYSLFSASEPGVWYDPTDMSTLYQNAAGTIPVTSFGQPVGLMLDKSRGSPSQIVTSDFSSSDGWVLGTGWAISSGALVGTSVAVAGATASFPQTIIPGYSYRTTYTITTISSNGVSLQVGGVNGTARTAPGTYTETLIAINSSAPSFAARIGTTTVSIDNLAITELPGLHATQSTDASRPLYGIVPVSGRRNLLTQSEAFNEAVWTSFNATCSANATTAPDGTLTADKLIESVVGGAQGRYQDTTATLGSYTVSGYVKAAERSHVQLSAHNGSSNYAWAKFDLTTESLVGSGVSGTATLTATSITPLSNGWYRVSLSAANVVGKTQFSVATALSVTAAFGYASYVGDGTSGIYLWGAQLETGSTPTAYQRVSTDLDVTEAGVASVGYLRFDGSTSWMVTPTITPGTDKVQVFVGLRKLSDAAVGMVVETGTGTENGTLLITAPRSTGVGNYRFISIGTILADVFPSSGYVAPITNIITGLGDISGDRATIRLSGTEVPPNTSDQGTGNYGNYPMYIGRRAGSTLSLQGHLFPIIVRFGPNLTAARIAATEAWVATKTGGVTL